MKSKPLSDQKHHRQVLKEFEKHLNEQSTIDDVCWSIAQNAIAHLDFEDCVIYLIEEGVLVQKAAHGPKNPVALDIFNPITIELGEGIVGAVAMSGKAEIIGNTSMDDRYVIDDDIRYSELSVPIINDGKVLGVIDSEHERKFFFTKSHLDILKKIAEMVALKIVEIEG